MSFPRPVGVLLLLAIVISGNRAFALEPSQVVFVIESYNRDYAWDKGYRSAIEEALGSRYTLEWYEMDTKRLPAREHQGMADGAWARYLALSPDLVILGDDAAMKFLGPRFATVRTPVVFLGINANPRNYLERIPPNMTGVLERPILKRSLVYINELLPGARRGLVLFDTDLTARATRDFEFGARDCLSLGDVDIDILLIGDFSAWKKAVLTAKDRYDYIITGLYQTIRAPNGTYVDPETLIEWTSANSPLPLFSFWDFSVGDKRAIGGRVLESRDMGAIAADMASRILLGVSPSAIPLVTDTPGKFLFSESQLKRWNITLPGDISYDATLIP